ncbi:MAG TPA: tRNA pseudouridine(54/55) synthase Pus10 [Desulfobacteria bacterium]|nr:tRNA pseudouridine(54/55) synthase Pus10 [Desulfobacteria bacterium]
MVSKDAEVAQGLETEAVVELARKIAREGPICDHCLGRQFAKIASGLSNEHRGTILRVALEEHGEEPKEGKCWVCNGLFEKIDVWVSRALETLEDYEFKSFLVGTKVNGLLLENEDLLWEVAGAAHAEPLKAELNREVGKRIERETGKRAEFEAPELVVILNLQTESVEVQSNAVYIYGRYLKFQRGIPQTRWFCRACRGKGCERCNFTGKMYPESVEELISGSLSDLFLGEEMVLHGCGREDIDACMLGSGRPFVLELKEPQRRYVDVRAAEENVNTENAGKIKVLDLQYVKKGLVAELKNAKAAKTYQARVEFKTPDVIGENAVKNALDALSGAVIEQRTPTRVAHRRADLVRERKVATARLVSFTAETHRAVIEVKCDAGLYIKELVSGDAGRTKPSLSALLGQEAEVTDLDVIDVDLNIPVLDYKL